MQLEDFLPNGQRQELLALAMADEAGEHIPPHQNRNAARLVKRGYASQNGDHYRITDAGWAWLREALEGRIPAQVTTETYELELWRKIRADFAEVGIRLPDID